MFYDKPPSVVIVFLWYSILITWFEELFFFLLQRVFRLLLSQKLHQSRPNFTSVSQFQDPHARWELWVPTSTLAGPNLGFMKALLLPRASGRELLTSLLGLGAESFSSPFHCGDTFSRVLDLSRVSVPAHLLSWAQGHAFCHLVGISTPVPGL